MSKLSNNLNNNSKAIINFMGGISYTLNPLNTLKIVSTSSIFGEPSYYIDGEFQSKYLNKSYYQDIFNNRFKNMTTSQIMEEVINEALDYDFKATIDFAITLREFYNMRLNPQVIMVLASKHKIRKNFTKENPNYFSICQKRVMSRGDDSSTQLTYYLYKFNSKNNLPNLLKKTWANHLNNLSKYEIAKYKNSNIGLIDTIRISHANSNNINELMQKGKVDIDIIDNTWESLLSSGKNWHYVLKNIKLGHMALLRNLKNIFLEEWSIEETIDILNMLKKGVKNGKQYPFRYYNAYKILKNNNKIEHLSLILDALEECIDLSIENLPKLKGKTVCLSDNSGSAHHAFTSEYGKASIADINNLSSLIAAINSDEGEVILFGDKITKINVSKRNGLLNQNLELNKIGKEVGMSTENGIWLFLDDAIKNNKVYDNIFIYSDMQAGHGDLYGLDSNQYKDFIIKGNNIDVLKLINLYRNKVNKKVNVFSIQTAGYNNSILPEYLYRCNILSGWTGKELLFAHEIIKEWDDIEQN